MCAYFVTLFPSYLSKSKRVLCAHLLMMACVRTYTMQAKVDKLL